MSTPASYLHTLAEDEAIAFVTSLQKVKQHLSQELQWLSVYAQQKTVQLQGIQTLLSEALNLRLLDANEQKPSSTARDSSLAVTDGKPTPAPFGVSNDSKAPTIAPATAAKPSTRQKRNSAPTSTAKAPHAAKPSVSSQPGTTQAKKASAVTPSQSKKNKPQRSVGLQQFLQRPFQDHSLTEAVSEILDRAQKPLSADDIMAKLYDGLSSKDYNRAKNSVTNILSVGKSKGKWKSTGRGLYANNAVAAAK